MCPPNGHSVYLRLLLYHYNLMVAPPVRLAVRGFFYFQKQGGHFETVGNGYWLKSYIGCLTSTGTLK